MTSVSRDTAVRGRRPVRRLLGHSPKRPLALTGVGVQWHRLLGYTDRGELYQLKHAGTAVDTRTYDDGGRLVTDAYNNTVTESRTYNLDNTLASITDNKSIGNLSYTWDANKNKTAETISGTMSNYGLAFRAAATMMKIDWSALIAQPV